MISNESKWAHINLNEPKQPKMGLNILKMVLYKLQIGLNDLKHGVNEP